MRSTSIIAPCVMLAACVGHDLPDIGPGPGSDSGSGSGSDMPAEGDCPGGPTCSPRTPLGLSFVGADPAAGWLPNGFFNDVSHQIASGGTDDIAVGLVTDTNVVPLALAFEAVTDDAPALVVAGSAGSTVTLHARGSGQAHLRIVDPDDQRLFGRYAYAWSEVAAIVPFPITEIVTGPSFLSGRTDFVFYRGHVVIAVGLLDDALRPHRLIDTSLRLTLAGATRRAWDELELANATAGHRTILVERDGAPAVEVGLDVVDHADEIVALASDDSSACFAALSGGAFIAGIPWTFTVDDSPGNASPWGPNCVENHGHAVTAAAGGKQLTTASRPGR